MSNYSFWFVVGSQFLYGPDVLDTVAARHAIQALVVLAVLAGRSADFFNKEVDEASAGGIADLLCNLGNRHA